jgi:hypothetical protein
MNRIMTALALSGMFVAAPAFARVHHSAKPSVAKSADKATDKTVGDKSETKTETAPATPDAAGSKPVKKTKKSKKVEKTEKTEGAPAEAPTTK